jgi:rRNA maturation endonuclease Nob1
MKCGKCGKEYKDSSKFCQNCGENLSRNCLACNAENPLIAKFCESCGAALGVVVPNMTQPAGSQNIVGKQIAASPIESKPKRI